MTVNELIEQLSEMSGDAEVHFRYQFGDYWRTEVAPRVDEVSEGRVTYSEYHRMPKVVHDEIDGDDERDQLQEVVILG